jgi:hypothetical protein
VRGRGQLLVDHGETLKLIVPAHQDVALASSVYHFGMRNCTALPGQCYSPKTNATRGQASLSKRSFVLDIMKAGLGSTAVHPVTSENRQQ